MADRIKTVSTYDGTSWSTEVPIGADASNVDVTLSNNTKTDLQTVLGSTPSGASITDRLGLKVNTSGGNVGSTVVSSNITNYDSSTTAGDAILTDTAAAINVTTSTLWSRFNLFRKKVSNNFENYFAKSSLVGANPGVTSTGSDTTAYTTAAINNYLSNVIGYTSASAPSAGTIATQLSTLNSGVTALDNKFMIEDTQSDPKLIEGNSRSGLSGYTTHADTYIVVGILEFALYPGTGTTSTQVGIFRINYTRIYDEYATVVAYNTGTSDKTIYAKLKLLLQSKASLS